MKNAFGMFGVSLILLYLITGCSTGNCRSAEQEAAKEKMLEKGVALTGKTSPAESGTAAQGRVFVYKLDGSLQCQIGSKKSPQDMVPELRGIKIYSSSSRHDGLVRNSICGAPTGYINVFEINEKDLAKAEKLQFKLWNP